MSLITEIRRDTLRHELAALKGKWIWFVILGAVTIVLGMLALGAPFAATMATMTFFSALLITAGVLELVGAFWTRDWSGFFLAVMLGVLYVVAGIVTINRPIAAAEVLTILIASMLLVGGLFRLIGSAWLRFEGWVWPAVSGAISAAMGILIWLQFPLSSLFVIGTFLGIDLIFTGWTWVMLGLGLRKVGQVLERGKAARAS